MAASMTPTHKREGDDIECWDDDDDLQFNDGTQFGAASSAGSVTNSSFRPSGHRDSISSRRSARSDARSEIDSNVADEDWQVPIQGYDEHAREEALASAKSAGIPLPANIPNSALFGGAIKRLSSRKPKRTFVDDWSDDVELPGPDTILQLRTSQNLGFPETIRQPGSTLASPVKSTASSWAEDIPTRLQPTRTNLDQFHDENNNAMSPNFPTIRASTQPHKTEPPAKQLLGIFQGEETIDDFDADLELPPVHQPLQLSEPKDRTGISSPILDDFDLEWAEGSIGVRVGGTARDGRSIPSSTISIGSPSVSSCLTGGSEEDGLDGLIFPEGPLDLTTPLKKQRETHTDDQNADESERLKLSGSRDTDDFFTGLEVDDGRAFASGKLTLNPNVKCKTEWPATPTRRSATTLVFTSGQRDSPLQNTRIPRLSSHDRNPSIHSTHSTQLETVSESGGPLSKFPRPQSRLGHASQSSISSLPTPRGTLASPIPSTPTRRTLGSRTLRTTISTGEPRAPSRQLRTKRSLPSIQATGASTTIQGSSRIPPNQDGGIQTSFTRPKTPIDRTASNRRTSLPKTHMPFIPAGASERQSHHASVKTSRPSRRNYSDNAGDFLSPQNTFNRLSRPSRPESMRLSLDSSKPESASPPAKRTITRPTRRRNFGDGTELQSFDDLPTSISVESRFMKNPSGRGAPRTMRARLSQSGILSNDSSPVQTSTPPSSSKPTTSLPHFARDTNASRNAREQRIASMTKIRDANTLSSLNPNWKAQTMTRISPNAAPVRSRKSRSGTKPPSKPHLIKPMGTGVQESKCKDLYPILLLSSLFLLSFHHKLLISSQC